MMDNSRIDFLNSLRDEFLTSALSNDGINTMEDYARWFAGRNQANEYEVRKIPVDRIDGWRIEDGTGNITHKSGKFFSIQGLRITTNFGNTPQWDQPIINQPEIGILGFITQKKDGVLHFLVQGKMEPGNVNLLQISPTLQATKSNYTTVHGGKKPAYLEYFLDNRRADIVTDQLQSEQGSRFLRKRNRNIIIRIRDDENIEVLPDFFWLTLGQIAALLRQDNIVNMDSRTVLSNIGFRPVETDWSRVCAELGIAPFGQRLLESYCAPDAQAETRFEGILSWFTNLKTLYEVHTQLMPLNQIRGWRLADGEVRHENGKYFSVIGVSVRASSREVSSWEQPLIESARGGVIAFVCQMKNGVLHFIVQARVEPGNFDIIELAPTLQFTPTNYEGADKRALPPFHDLVVNARPEQIRVDQLQSEEGGRFYHDQNRYQVVELPEDLELGELPENYAWMTLNQIKRLIRFNNYFNIEARGLLSCLNP
ncbi:MAG: NDP-hexose 2,3-dehydratase family protein [Thiogranum sp.]|nr:NDP-hexose 2,3-dehydratase family protein [Thiogranum sp.]